MNCEFHFQDPASANTTYLLEAIIDASRGATFCSGMFAFASRAGVDSLIGDREIQDFLQASPMSLLVGIDAVTSRDTLVRLQELEQEFSGLTVRVFHNPTNALFPPEGRPVRISGRPPNHDRRVRQSDTGRAAPAL